MALDVLAVGIMSMLSCVLLPGWGLKQSLIALGMKFRSDPVSSWLSSFAFGVHVNAVTFIICWVIVDPAHPIPLATAIISVDIALGLLGFWFSRKRPTINIPLFAVLFLGTVLGVFASLRFPSTLDSLQILQVQNYILGWGGGHLLGSGAFTGIKALMLGGLDIPIQSGFGGLTLVPSLIHWDLPVTTVAAANKVLLFWLSSAVALYAARQLRFEFSFLAAVLILGNFVLSHLGIWGLFTTGKDSAYSIVMAVAALLALTETDDDAHEPGLFMSAALLLGAAATPYLMIFWALYFLYSGGAVLRQVARQAIWCVVPLSLTVVGVKNHFAPPGSSPVALLHVLILAAGATFALVAFSRRVSLRDYQIRGGLLVFASAVPAICILGIAVVMPVTGHIIIAVENGKAVTESYAPLDGKMTAADFLFKFYKTNNPVFSLLAIFALVFTPFLSSRLRTPFFLALFSFLPLTAFLAFLHVKLGLGLLPDFNLWDITRNTLQWWIGALAAIFVLLGGRALIERTPKLSAAIVPFASVLFLLGVTMHLRYHAFLWSQQPTVTPSGGYDHPASAAAMDFIWREGRGLPAYVSGNSTYSPYFYFFPMYGAKKIAHFRPEVIGSEPEQVFLTNAADLKTIIRFAEQRGASGLVKEIEPDAFVVKLINDGKGSIDLSAIPAHLSNLVGAFEFETSGDVGFRWAPQKVTLELVAMHSHDQQVCLNLKFVNAWADSDLSIKLTSTLESVTIAVPPTATFSNPAEANICGVQDSSGLTSIDILSNKEARHFAGDPRAVSFGMLWPLN
ncbi:hypothetical protein [Agrobacterium sp. fls2-241-TYG-188a]|uniref:hypothetical protein n=1 Tax=Agrobacterium sp. fls2-241-TYG-188a TaxID=3040275 RepID=UPI00254CF0DE|nr:hypothetical protein [Agrobacterium sp. fls2-241-TYG-188a]